MEAGSERQVFRYGKPMLWAGLLFAGMPTAMSVGATIQWSSHGIEVNGVTRSDLGAIATFWGLCAVFVIVGGTILLAYRNSRVEVDSVGLTIFELWGRPKFKSSWDEVRGYARAQEGAISHRIGMRGRNSQWQISGPRDSVLIPMVQDIGGLQVAIIKHLVPDLIGGIVRPATPTALASAIDTNGRRGRDRYVMFFSVAWDGFLIFFIVGALIQFANSQDKNFPVLCLMMACAICFALIPHEAFATAWRQYLKGRIRTDQDQVSYFDGRVETSIRWKDIRLIDLATVDLGENGTMKRLWIVSNDSAIGIDDGFDEFDAVANMAIQNLPPNASYYA